MLRVIAPGALCTVQDLGRPGYQRFGVPVGGAMDPVACIIANRLAGNPPSAACLEITAGGAAFEVVAPCVIAVAGGDLGATLGSRPLPTWTSAFVRTGQRIHFEARRSGARAYLALAGGVDAPLVLGSRSTYLPGRFGGLGGRALQMDDVIRPASPPADPIRLAGRIWPKPVDYTPLIRILPFHIPPDLPDLSDLNDLPDLNNLTALPWRVGATSNRIGLRLEGAVPHIERAGDLPSFGVFPGAIQLPPDGRPILLMADAQPTGGYPVIAVAIQADLHRAAQLLPGDEVRFAWTTRDAAVAAWRALCELLDSPIAADEGVELAAAAQG
ncbi:MAG: biotin-dependent carboxyltransferase family protein [Anaerolineae bacterium]|nr:biotin-dependent carboxyltransferase family protein [Candidatus Roseilinea sp.]MDW8450360.1 biotin-dependent carboxyltransferase family protein [Anaerolineae bacterium]